MTDNTELNLVLIFHVETLWLKLTEHTLYVGMRGCLQRVVDMVWF